MLQPPLHPCGWAGVCWGYRKALQGQVRHADFFCLRLDAMCRNSPRKGTRGVFLSFFQACIIIYKCRGGGKQISAGFQPAQRKHQPPQTMAPSPLWLRPALVGVPHCCSHSPCHMSAAGCRPPCLRRMNAAEFPTLALPNISGKGELTNPPLLALQTES